MRARSIALTCRTQGGAYKTNRPSSLWYSSQSFCRCVVIWTGSCSPAADQQRMEASSLCILVHDWSGTEIIMLKLRRPWWLPGHVRVFLTTRTFWDVTDIKTDNKLLVPLLSSKHMDDLPPRVLCSWLRLARFDYSIKHFPGKLLYTDDTLSRTPSPTTEHAGDLQQDVEAFVDAIVVSLPASQERLEVYCQAQAQDLVCTKDREYCHTGWPEKSAVSAAVSLYWKARSSLTVHNNIILYNSHIAVPLSLQKEALIKIHEGHQEISQCCMRTKSSVWWPGVSAQV